MSTFNPSVAVHVVAYTYGPEELDAEGNAFRPVTGLEPGYRLDVQQECLEVFPALEAFVIEPESPIHDCGPNGVRLYAASVDELLTAAPTTGSPWDIWLDNRPPVPEGEEIPEEGS